MTTDEVKKIIPHREPMLLVDNVVQMEPEKTITTTWHIDPEREIFKGHFPGDPEVLPEEIRNAGGDGEVSADALRVKTKAFEKEYILKVIQKYQGNVAKAAEEMQIAKKNLYKKLNEYDIKYGKDNI